MGIAKSLRKSGRLGQFAKGLSDVFNQLAGDDSLEEYLKEVARTKGMIKGRYDYQPNKEKQSAVESTFSDPFLFGGQDNLRRTTALDNLDQMPDTELNPDANKKALGDIAEFVLTSLANQKVKPEIKSSAISGLDLFRQAMTPGTKEKSKLFELSAGERLVDETGKVIVPGEDKKKDLKLTDQFKGISAKGYWEVDYSDPDNPQLVWKANPDYKSDADANDSYADFSKLIGEVSEGIGKIQLIKTAKSNKEGMFTVPDPYGLGTYELTQEELTTLKEQVKNQYTDKAVTLVTQQGLDPAVKDIRKLLKAHDNDLDKSIEAFKKLNPEFSEDQIRILKDYFTLFLE